MSKTSRSYYYAVRVDLDDNGNLIRTEIDGEIDLNSETPVWNHLTNEWEAVSNDEEDSRIMRNLEARLG
jgi:hypothetical protein